jgi:hypothetical protein
MNLVHMSLLHLLWSYFNRALNLWPSLLHCCWILYNECSAVWCIGKPDVFSCPLLTVSDITAHACWSFCKRPVIKQKNTRLKMHLTFMWPCIVKVLSTTNKMQAVLYSILYYCQCCTCFRWRNHLKHVENWH